MKHVKESIMIDETANQNIKNTAINGKSSEETMEVVKEMEKKLLRGYQYSNKYRTNK